MTEFPVAGPNADDSTAPVHPSTDFEPPRAVTRPASSVPWNLGDLGWFLLFFVAIYLFVGVGAGVGYALLQDWSGWELKPEKVFRNTFVVLGFQVLIHTLLFSFIYRRTVAGYGCPFWASLQMKRLAPRLTRISLLGGALLAVGVRYAPTLLPDKETFPLQELFTSVEAAYAVSVFAITLAPFMEELIFRGFMFPILQTRWGIRAAVIGTAFLFTLIHVPQYWEAWNHLLFLAVVSLALSMVRGWTGTLVPSILMHTSYNLVMTLFLYDETQRFQQLAVLCGS